MIPSETKPDRPTAIIITLVFLVISIFWNLLSDHLFAILLNRPGYNYHTTNFGHWFFIVFSTIMLFWLLRFWETTVVESQESLKKVNRSLKCVSECSRAITRLEDEEALMQEICRISVEVGGHRMAWVAFKQDDAKKSIKPAGHWGADNVYLENLQASWSADCDIGQGPAGTCIRTGEIVIFQNLLANARFAPWHQQARKYGYASCIALPLKEKDRVFGALIIFNGQTDAFTPEKAELLAEMAEDLSFGIKTLRLQAQHRKETEERLILAVAMDQTSDGIITFDPQGIIQYVNPSLAHLSGIPEEQCLGVNIHHFEYSNRNPQFYRALLRVIETNQPLLGRFINKCRNENIYDIDTWIAPIMAADGSVSRYVATMRDISQEIVLQRQLRQAQKLEALATLSGGIAHDFNNILAIIITNTEMCLEDTSEHDPLYPFLELTLKASLRGKNLIRQFLAISRKSDQPLKPTNLTNAVKECISLLQATLPKTIEVQQQFPEHLSLVRADPTQIHQVIMNLCTNAADAMGRSPGVLNISLDETTLSAGNRINYPDLPAGDYVRLMVTDNGHGMYQEVLDRIFDPFFTTKEQGKGTGLGLSIAHGIVKSHNGHISAVSIVEGGTTFTVLLPATTATDSDSDSGDTKKTKQTSVKREILFVDDEADYVAIMKIALERCGYKVTAHTDSQAALNMLRQDPSCCDLLITDQTMPHLTGTQLAAAALRIRPDLPIILCSGSSPETEPAVSNENVAALGISKLLFKPVRRSELLATVEQLLSIKTTRELKVININE